MTIAKKTKAEVAEELIAAAVSAGEKRNLSSVDFSDPNRAKTCLEVDFPILPINQVAQIEGNAGKPVYQMSKWWARRRSSVFRSMLIAAAAKAPEDPSETAKTVWDAYYANHQDNEEFGRLKVADIFMGGGTTLVEGARLGMQMQGNDLSPIAWLVVKNELSNPDLDEVNRLFDHVEAEVKHQIMPYFACDGPGGERGTWTELNSGNVMDENFDPLSLTPEQRKGYVYSGPEVIYTFWAKHGPCMVEGCGHRTPLMTSPVVATKTLSVKAWQGVLCSACSETYDIERYETRMAPDAPLIVSDSEGPFSVMDNDGAYICPHCGHQESDPIAFLKSESSRLPKKIFKNKKVNLSLLMHPDWMSGEAGKDEFGAYGGTATSDPEATARWFSARAERNQLVEFRGSIPAELSIPDFGLFQPAIGNIPKRSTFTCQESTCGRQQDVMAAVRSSGQTAPASEYALQCYSPQYQKSGAPYNGRYFKAVTADDVARAIAAEREWSARKGTDLSEYSPRSELPYGMMTHIANGDLQKNYGYTHWHKMFNARQLLVHALLLKAIDTAEGFGAECKEVVLGAFQQYLRNQNMFCFWDISRDCMAPMMSNNNYHPKSTPVENSVFADLGRGNWASCRLNTLKGLEWCKSPWETVSNTTLAQSAPELADLVTGKSSKVYPGDKVLPSSQVTCGSSTELKELASQSFDLVVTDPPFGGLLHYSELADFFYVWLRLTLKDSYPSIFGGEYTPKTLEAVSNKARHPDDPDAFYKRLLTECWREANRLLKPSGILAFTFHHSEDEPWVDVLESLFDAGYYLEATYPIRSDETKGKGEFGSKTIEYDIIHVCRKRIEEPTKISWARLRRRILADVRQLQGLLEHHQAEGLPVADLQVIKRGKALEYFSRHYGQVYLEEGREFTVSEALVGINQILDDQSETEAGGTPVICEPSTRQFLRIFAGNPSVERDQLQKFLRGSGLAPSTFVSLGWATETTRPKAFQWRSPLEFAQERRDSARASHRDFDQAMVLIGACYPESGINTKKILNDEFKPHPALGQLLDWLSNNGADSPMRQASMTARQLYTRWEADHQTIVQEQIALFGMEDEL